MHGRFVIDPPFNRKVYFKRCWSSTYMIIYSGTKDGFIDDLCNGILEEKIGSAMEERFGRHAPQSEVRSWSNSLTYMGMVLENSTVPSDTGIAIEYNIPYTSKRVDFIMSGYNAEGHNSAVIVELKQWEHADSVLGKDGVVRTYINGGEHETTHPSYQAWSYATAIGDFNADVQDLDVKLQPCACLHNYIERTPEPLLDSIYEYYIQRAPVFSKKDGKKLKQFLENILKKGDKGETIFMIDRGKLRPSKSLQDVLSSMMLGNREFVMIDTQKVVYEEILHSMRQLSKSDRKKTIIIRGGPGTGKTVLAINLLAEIIAEGSSAAYVSKNSAPRSIYNCKLKGSMKRSRIDALFKGSGSFIDAPENTFDVLLVDEAHRLNEKSGLYASLGENQVMELIRSSRLSVFFIDEDQRVTIKDIGTESEIRKYARRFNSTVSVMELDSQFRCSGSDGYLEWVDNLLQIRETASFEPDSSFEYDFRVYDDPNEMRADIESLNSINNKSRMVAGYCWNWISSSKNDTDVHDITIPEYGFEMSWNLGNTTTWAIDPESIREAGCIHTCQGLEFDYVGVIIGPDLRYDPSTHMIITDASERAKTDSSLKGLKKGRTPEEQKALADKIIKNTYRVLMSRGMKGCFVYCIDRDLSDHIRKMCKTRFD